MHDSASIAGLQLNQKRERNSAYLLTLQKKKRYHFLFYHDQRQLLTSIGQLLQVLLYYL